MIHAGRLNILALAVAALAAVALAGCNPPLDPSADPDPYGPLSWWMSPTQGHPALLKVGSRLPVMFKVPSDFRGRAEFRLVDAFAPDRDRGSVPLVPERELTVMTKLPAGPLANEGRSDAATEEQLTSGELKVPDYADPGVYDLVVALIEPGASRPTRTRTIPRAVALYGDLPERFRFVQLSNMNVGNVTAPDFSDELVREVNLLAPAFVLTTGDYTEWSAARNDPTSWRRVKEYFARFEAPVFLVAGDHDHADSFREWVAPSRSGRFSFGPYHGILLHDNYRNPIDQDTAQTLWLDEVLKTTANARLNFLVSPNDSLRVFDAWRKLGYAPADYVRRHRVGMIFVGGHDDWDGRELAGKLAGVSVHYLRTHESSTCMRGKATGRPHYRIIDVAGDRVRTHMPADGVPTGASHSTPVGSLTVQYGQPNDGSASEMRLTVINRMTIPLRDVRVKLNMARQGGLPEAAGARIERIITHASTREVWLRVDCPDRGAAAVAVGPADSLPPAPAALDVSLLGDPVLTYRPARTADGFGYYTTGGDVTLRLVNRAELPRNVWPAIRLDGNLLSLRGVRIDQPLTLAPGEERILPLRLELGLASAGEHWITVHLRDDPLPHVLATKVVEVNVVP